MSEPAVLLETVDLCMRFGGVEAVSGVDFRLTEGCIEVTATSGWPRSFMRWASSTMLPLPPELLAMRTTSPGRVPTAWA